MNFTINPETNRPVRIGGPTYNKLVLKYYTDDEGNILDQRKLSDSIFSFYNIEKFKPKNERSQSTNKYTINPENNKKVRIGSKNWNILYNKYNWNGKKFTTKREHILLPILNTVEKRREYNKYFDRKKQYKNVSLVKKFNEDVTNYVKSDMGYSVEYYNTKDNVFIDKRNTNKSLRGFVHKTEDKEMYVKKSIENDKMFRKVYIENNFKDVSSRLCKFIKNGLIDGRYNYLVSICLSEAFFNANNELVLMYTKDDRIPSERILNVFDKVDEMIEMFVQRYWNHTFQHKEDEEVQGPSGLKLVGIVGGQVRLLPLKCFVGRSIETPTILGHTILNPCIDDNKCLQRCLILSVNETISRNRNTNKPYQYDRYWKKPEKNLVYGHTIPQIEKYLHIENDVPFFESYDKFKLLEDYLHVKIVCYEMKMFDGFDKKSVKIDNLSKMSIQVIFNSDMKYDKTIHLCILTDVENSYKHFVYIRNIVEFKKHFEHMSSLGSNHLSRMKKCRWCDCYESPQLILIHEMKCHRDVFPEKDLYILSDGDVRLQWSNQKYKNINPVCVYADFECSIAENGVHTPIILSACTVSRTKMIKNEIKVFHSPNSKDSDFCGFIDYLISLRKKVLEIFYTEYDDENVNNDYMKTHECPFCHCKIVEKEEMEKSDKIDNDQFLSLAKEHEGEKDWYKKYMKEKKLSESYLVYKLEMKEIERKIMNNEEVSDDEINDYQEYLLDQNKRIKVKYYSTLPGMYSNGKSEKYYSNCQYICTCCNKCKNQLTFTKSSYVLPVYFHNGSRYDYTFVMRILENYNQKYEKERPISCIPNSMDKEMMINYQGIQFKDSYKMISAPLKKIVSDTLGSNIDNYKITKELVKEYLQSKNKEYRDEYIELMTRKEPMFYNLITSYSSLKTRKIPDQIDCYDELKNSIMSDEDYNHMKLLFKTFNIKNWGEYYELYNVLDVTLLADAFEHFRDSTLQTFNVDASHYITTPQMSYSLFIKNIDNNDLSRFNTVSDKWSKYCVKINKNEGHSEEELQKIFKERMTEFYKHGGIKLMCKEDMDDFISLKNNLRGGLTQITTRYAQKNLEDEEDNIYYLDANNLYGGTMHRMMPYEIVRTTEKEINNIKKDPLKFVNSLGTFDEYGYFIDCDIDVPAELHDYLNDLPLFPSQKYGCYSEYMNKLFENNNIKNNDPKVKKLICDLLPKKNYVVHYTMLQLGLQLGYKLKRINNVIKFRQAPFIYEYVNNLSEMRAKHSKNGVLKNLFKLLANSIYGKFVETGLNRMKVKIATSNKGQENILNKYGVDLLDDYDVYDENLFVAKLSNPKKRMIKPFFIGFAILDMSKYIIYDFFYNVLKKNFNNVQLLGQDTDSLIVKMDGHPSKICELYESFDFSEIDHRSYFYTVLQDYYNEKVDKNMFNTFESFINYNTKVPGPIFKDEHNGHRITEFCGLKPKMYCILDENNIVHNACKGVPSKIYIDNELVSIKNMELYKRVLFAENKDDICITGRFSRFNNQKMNISTIKQDKIMFTPFDNKRYVCDGNIKTYAWGHKDIPVNENEKFSCM